MVQSVPQALQKRSNVHDGVCMEYEHAREEGGRRYAVVHHWRSDDSFTIMVLALIDHLREVHVYGQQQRESLGGHLFFNLSLWSQRQRVDGRASGRSLPCVLRILNVGRPLASYFSLVPD